MQPVQTWEPTEEQLDDLMSHLEDSDFQERVRTDPVEAFHELGWDVPESSIQNLEQLMSSVDINLDGTKTQTSYSTNCTQDEK
jgi:hypothetical protein